MGGPDPRGGDRRLDARRAEGVDRNRSARVARHRHHHVREPNAAAHLRSLRRCWKVPLRGPCSEHQEPRSEHRGPRREHRGPPSQHRGLRKRTSQTSESTSRTSKANIANLESEHREPRSEHREPRSEHRGPRNQHRGPRSRHRGPRVAPIEAPDAPPKHERRRLAPAFERSAC